MRWILIAVGLGVVAFFFAFGVACFIELAFRGGTITVEFPDKKWTLE